jgi:hypothetical protein
MDEIENISDEVLSRLSTNDLNFLSKNQINQISTEGLQLIQEGLNQPQTIDRSIPTPENLAQSQQENIMRESAEPQRSFNDRLMGVGEAALSSVTAIPASIAGAFGAVPSMIQNIGTQSNAPEQRMQEISESLTYQPRTQAGQEYLQNIGDVARESGIAGLTGMGNIGRGVPRIRTKPETPSAMSQVAGMTTGTGGEAFSQAFKAGKQGGERARAFLENMRQEVPVETVLSDAKQALQQMKADKSASYVANKVGWAADNSTLDFNKIDKAYKNLENSVKEQGKWLVGKDEIAKIQEVNKVLNDWKKTPSLHTTVGLDALKQRIDAIYPDNIKQNQAQRVITGTSKAIKDTIIEQAPDYADAMKDYERMSATINEIENALSLGNKKSKDTALRKLQSLTRNNVQTNYGGRLDMAQQLADAGGKDIMPAVAGQALSSVTPRGLAGQSGASLAALGAYFNPATLATLPLTSPRMMGEFTYGLGRASNAIPQVRIPYNQASNIGILGSMLQEENQQ